ncbi:helix-turn-helix domain-containing protein [Streptomyces sp. CPS1]
MRFQAPESTGQGPGRRCPRTTAGTTPARYVESIRFGIAKSLLDQGYTATQAASLAGFPGYESLRRVFARELSISPAAYQRRFATARDAE